MPRVHQDQKGKFDSDELFRRISRESEVLFFFHFSLDRKENTERKKFRNLDTEEGERDLDTEEKRGRERERDLHS